MAHQEDEVTPQDASLFDYLARAKSSFVDDPLNAIDATILSYATYFNYAQGVLWSLGPDERVPLPVAICGISRRDLFGPSALMRMEGDAFLTAFLQSPRFMELKVGRYVSDLSPDEEKQFAAVTFYLPDGSAFASCRGSDSSVAGWKENFNLSFMEAVPSQLSARDYLEQLAGSHSGALYVGGHSKGGNLAEYAALTCCDETYARLRAVYSLDGPGFAHHPSERILSEGYARLLHKVVPESSIFGMMMEDRPASTRRIVRSSGVLFAQHVPSRWLVEGNDFVTADRLSPEADIIDRTVNTWASSYPPEQRELFFNTIFDVLRQGNGTYWRDRDVLYRSIAVAEAATQAPPELMRVVMRMVRDIAPVLGNETVKRALESFAPQDADES